MTLINATLTAIPIFFFSFFRVPTKVITKLEAIQRRFLWGGGLDQRKIAWVNWKTICQPKDRGGLGVKDLRTFNAALLGKWRWDLFHKHEEPWAKLLDSKYGGWRALEEGITANQDSIWWKDIISILHQQQNSAIRNETGWIVGGGDKFRFWEDPWLDTGMSLREKYPRLYNISSQKQTTISCMGTSNSTGWEWNLNWRRDLFESELLLADSFIGDLAQQQIQPHREDKWIWKHDHSGHYSSKSGYDLIWREIRGSIQNSDFVDLWKLKIPAKSAIFAWRLIKDRLPTKMNLIRRQVVVNDRLCPFCGLKDEEAEHLFFSCSCTLPLWWESISWANLATALPINPRDHFLQHTLGTAGVRNHTRWKCWWVALTWSIWNHRNKIVFQNHTFNGSRLMDEAVFVLWSWIKSMEKDFAVHLNQWSSNLKEAFNS